MSVMCVMSFVIILATVALTVTEAAHQNVVYQNKIQQAYFTAKSAADKTQAYISSIGGPSSSADEGTLRKELYDISQDLTSHIEGNLQHSTIGDYQVDIYPTTNPNVFKVVATSTWKEITSSAAILVGPTSGGALYDDAIVGTGSTALEGSPQVGGGMTLNMSDMSKSSNGDVYIGGTITNTGSLNFGDNQHAYTTEYFQNHRNSSLSMIASGDIANTGKLSVGRIYTVSSVTSNDNDQDVWQYYSYLVCKDEFKIKDWDVWNDDPTKRVRFAAQVSSQDKAILCGGNFISVSSKIAEIHAPVYIGGGIDLQSADDGQHGIVFKEPVYIDCNGSNPRIQIKGNVTFEGGLYIRDASIVHNGDILDKNGQDVHTASYIHYGDDPAFATYNALLNQKLLIPQQRVDMYQPYEFTDTQRAAMGMDSNEGTANEYKITVTNDSSNQVISCLKTYVGGALQSSQSNGTYANNDITISESGYISQFNLVGCKSDDAVTIYFDTRTAENNVYKDIYLRLTTTDCEEPNNMRGCKFYVRGKGNVYFYLDGEIKFHAHQLPIKSIDDRYQPHFWIISNSTNKNLGYSNATIYFNDGTNTSQNDDARNEFYIYAPGTVIQFDGSTGFYGFMVGYSVRCASGSGVALTYVQPKNADGTPNNSYSQGSNVTYGTLLRLRS